MSRTDCICNRNIKIIAAYVRSRLGHHDSLFDGLPYPTDHYSRPEDFFLNEDEWTTFEIFHRIFRKARHMVGEPYFYFNCGASSAALRSWGRFNYFVRLFRSPSDGYRRISFFNQNFNDTKDIEVIVPPYRDREYGRFRTILMVRYHSDIDLQKDYISDPYRRGIIASIPTIWDLRPADVRQPLSAFDPVILLNEEEEFKPLGLAAKIEGNRLTVRDPMDGTRKVVGEKIILEPDFISGKPFFLGKYRPLPESAPGKEERSRAALIITETLVVNNRIILREGEIFNAPYFVLDVTYDELSLIERFSLALRVRNAPSDTGKGLIDTINRLRETMEARNRAYHELEQVNARLIEAKKKVDDYARNLEQKVEERTMELCQAKEELMRLNRDLEAKVDRQVRELKRYSELRRYLSPKITEKILSSGAPLGAEPQRRMVSIVFSDIRNFSSLTDNLEPEELFHLLDRYLSEMTAIVHAYEGTLNKIIGDGMLVFFGDPVPIQDHAHRAVMMAVD
ncbi:MAG: hypothetical protein JRF57_12360, partial [Deltaproteobacteria bacterium]|nr:hypothetical protein [Deltaproteobacteria bacterium]